MKNKKIITLLATLTGLTIASIALINKIIFFISGKKGFLNEEQGEYYDWRFGKIFYKKEGTGSPILLLHSPDAATSSYEWNYLITSLSSKYTVYAIDLLGCGKSDKPKLTYTNYLYVQLISDFIRNVIGHKTSVIASGKASSFVVMACNIDSTIFNKIMMLNPDTIKDLNKCPGGSAKMMKKLIELPVVGTLLYNILYSKGHIEKRLYETYFNESYMNDQIAEVYFESSHRGGIGGKYLMSSLKSRFLNINITSALKNINNSIYMIVGDNNPDKEELLNEYTELNSAIESYVMPNSRKYTQLECTNELKNQIDIFF